ncbi:hypothetical protein QGN23_14170 [Chryseobacterium gotjawalense]|uniref:Addiction module protein n=1 Tax=Chryseobacterium gotjawalense TaxID=3042315 RepID=A0ABY8RC57_9FLAO|nr:hypothetical protein [Chryseobacterium sp. wdc7]WHF51551.1 hypothetical protein QGN23_14170 [Chryseobacterium sp. wdc7]
MNTITLEDLTKKLQNAPASVLEKIWGYADALLEKKQSFELSEEQKKHLKKQNDVPLEECLDADKVFENLKSKHGL